MRSQPIWESRFGRAAFLAYGTSASDALEGGVGYLSEGALEKIAEESLLGGAPPKPQPPATWETAAVIVPAGRL